MARTAENLLGKKTFDNPRRKLVDIIGTDLKEIVYEDVDWICLAYDMDQYRVLVNTTMKYRVL
jgi:hypothetical protein